MAKRYGLDVSKHQGSLDFKAIAKENDFVILRIGYGVSGTADQKDAKFETYYKQAKEAGLKIGGYYYSYAKSVAQAKTEAQNCLKYMGKKEFDYPIYYDCEDPGTVGKQSTATIAKMCDAFCEVVKAAGYVPGVYASTSWFKSKGVKNAKSEWIRWEANYGKNDGKTVATSLYNKDVPMHQYTSKYSGKYSSNGKAIKVDRNIDYSTLEKMPKKVEEVVVEEPKKEETKVATKEITYQRAIFPMKYGRISAKYNQTTAHKKCSTGTKKDYPTDIVGVDSGRDWAYAPCDMEVLRRYTSASHAIWLRSVNKVKTPYGIGYLYMMSEHQDNSEMKAVGKVYEQGEKLFREGRNGNATGYHLHVSFGFCKTKKGLGGTGWIKNNKGAWILNIPGVTNIKIEQALYLNTKFTTKTGNLQDITFKTCTSNTYTEEGEVEPEVKTVTYTVKTNGGSLNVRKGKGKTTAKVGTVKNGTKVKVVEDKSTSAWKYITSPKTGYVSSEWVKK